VIRLEQSLLFLSGALTGFAIAALINLAVTS
jgi:hypothetical protein